MLKRFFLLALFFPILVFAEGTISQISLLGGLHNGVGDFASTSSSNPKAYFADDGLAFSLRYNFYLFSNQEDLWSDENLNKFNSFCPGDYLFLNGYWESEFFTELHSTKNTLNANIVNIYSDHYSQNIQIQNLNSWNQYLLSIGGKLRYAFVMPFNWGLYAVGTVGGGMLEAPTYDLTITDHNNSSAYKIEYDKALLLNATIGLGAEINVTKKIKFFSEARWSYSTSNNYFTRVVGQNDESLVEYESAAEITNVLAQLGITIKL